MSYIGIPLGIHKVTKYSTTRPDLLAVEVTT